MSDRMSAEEFYSRCLHNAQILDDAARRSTDAGDPVAALAFAWGADVNAAQAVLWERIMVVATTPQRQFFRVAEALMSSLHAGSTPSADPTIRDVIEASRAALLDACDPGLRSGIEAAWADSAYLSALAAPTIEQFDAAVAARLGGLSPSGFVQARRVEAAQVMSEAQAQRIRGESVPAIQSAYESDFLALEAYLVESAMAAGDEELLSVLIRWELAAREVTSLPGLPEGFVAAVSAVREAMAAGLGDGDGPRFKASLLPA